MSTSRTMDASRTPEVEALVMVAADRHGIEPPAITWRRRRGERRAVVGLGRPPVLQPIRREEQILEPARLSTGWAAAEQGRIHLRWGTSYEDCRLVALHEVAHLVEPAKAKGRHRIPTAESRAPSRRSRAPRRVHTQAFYEAALELYARYGLDSELVLAREVRRSPAARRAHRALFGTLPEANAMVAVEDGLYTVEGLGGRRYGWVWAELAPRFRSLPGRWRRLWRCRLIDHDTATPGYFRDPARAAAHLHLEDLLARM